MELSKRNQTTTHETTEQSDKIYQTAEKVASSTNQEEAIKAINSLYSEISQSFKNIEELISAKKRTPCKRRTHKNAKINNRSVKSLKSKSNQST
jgi:hypothetical protein